MKNLIKRRGMVEVAAIIANPRNWRTHPKFQQDVLRELLNTVGWVSGVIINERDNMLLDGHLRVMLAEKNGETQIPAVFVNVPPKMALKLLALLDPVTGMSFQDADNLNTLRGLVDRDQIFLRQLLSDIQEANISTQPTSTIGSGSSDSGGGGVNVESTTLILIGDYSFRITHTDYYDWRERMYQEFGLNRKDISTGIYQRLGFDEINTDQ